jgi:pyruvate/2-oxoglutarate/acetoin dehydrogenase E1 component
MLMSFGESLRAAMIQAMETDERVFAYGQGINDLGGFFGSTVGIKDKFTEARCFDVPLSEESLVGMGVGAAILGRRPIYVALRIDFLLLAMNQIVNYAAKWPSICGYQLTVPLTIRAIIGKYWGQGAQHAGTYHSLFSHVPGLEVVIPSSVADAPRLLLASIFSENPTIFVESKALYDMKGEVELPIQPLAFGKANAIREGKDITFVAISHMVGFAQSVASKLDEHDVSAEVIDLRTLAPLDEAKILESVTKTGRVAVFDVGWPRFGLAAEVARVVCMSSDCKLKLPLVNVAQKDEHVPAGCFLEHDHYPIEERVVTDILKKLEV